MDLESLLQYCLSPEQEAGTAPPLDCPVLACLP